MQSTIESIVNHKIIGDIVENDYLRFIALALIFLLVSLFLFELVKIILVGRLKTISSNTASKIDDAVITIIDSIKWPFYLIATIYLFRYILNFNDKIGNVIDIITTIAIILFVISIIQKLIDFALYTGLKKIDSKNNPDTAAIHFFAQVIKIFIWGFAGVIILQNFGINVSAILGGIGIIGLAAGFAVQNILKDMFAFVSIYFDRTFKPGDFISISPEESGTVTSIGLKSTRIKTAKGTELVIPNSVMTSANIDNSHSTNKRREVFNLWVAYDTSTAKLKEVNKLVEKIISANEDLEFTRCHVKEITEYALKFEIVYYVLSRDYKLYMDTKQEVIFKILDALEKEKIKFTYPTQKVIYRDGK